MKIADVIPPARPAKEVSTIAGNTWAIHMERTPIHTLDQLIKHCEIDLTVWEVERFVANKWEVALKPPAYTELFTMTKAVASKTRIKSVTNTVPMWQRDKGNTTPLHENLFQIKAFLKKKVDVVNARKEIEELKKLAKIGAWKPVKRTPQPDTGNMLEIAPVDHHFGKLSWEKETGHGNYDIKIAEKLFDEAFDEILSRASAYNLDEIWLVLGNDMLQTDDVEGRTTSGTQVDTDTRFYKAFSVARTTAIRSIEKARRNARRVKVVIVPGNHDRKSCWHLGDSLQAWFKDCPDVEIDNEPKQFKYHEFGSVMLGFAHGDKGKRHNYPLLMATERPQMFGRTRYREIHTGDKHHERVEEHHGVKIRILSTLCEPDAWHAENALVGNVRRTEAFVWNKEKGLLGTLVFTP